MSSSITRVLHTTTWDYFTSRLPDRFSGSPKEVKEVIMTDIYDLVQQFWRISSDGAVGAPFFEMRRLLEILQGCFRNVQVCSNMTSVFATAVDLADKILQTANSNSRNYSAQSVLDNTEIRHKFKILFDGYQKIFDQSLSTSKDLGDMLRLLPGVVVQKCMGMQEMVDLYRIEPDLLKRFIKSTIEPIKLPSYYSPARYILDDYLSSFLQDRDRSQLYYCDPVLQHTSICRHFLSFLGKCRRDAFGFQ